MEIILYNLQGKEKEDYLKKLKLIEPTADFLTETKGNPERAVIDIVSCIDKEGHIIDENGHIDDDRFHEIDTLLKNAGFYIFPHDDNFKPENGKVIKTREITLKRNLLIVGNGFDIAHGLNTKYTNFLDELTKINNAFLILANTNSNSKHIGSTISYNFSANDILTNLESNIIDNILSPTIKNNIKDNSLLVTIKNKIGTYHFDFNESKFLKAFDILLSDIYQQVFEQINFDIEEIYHNRFSSTYSIDIKELEKDRTQISTALENLKNKNDKSSVITYFVNILQECLLNFNKLRLDDYFNQYLGSNITHEKFDIYPNIKNLKIKTCIKWFLAKYYIYNNSLIQYFLKKYTEKSIRGENWIDIEAELSNIVKKVESTTGIDKDNLDRLENELDVFILLLRNYLIHEENVFNDKINDNQVKKIPKINEIASQITHLLSFNYTNTFRLLYYSLGEDNVDFIHGSLPENNLVLGVNETLNNINENNELICIYFKKYFQRIFKKTGAKYADWLNDKNGINFDTVYIYGHSLDITDKEILSRVINDIHVDKIVIYYHNKAHYRQEISNLVKILDKNIFLKYVAEHKIEFEEQSS